VGSGLAGLASSTPGAAVLKINHECSQFYLDEGLVGAFGCAEAGDPDEHGWR